VILPAQVAAQRVADNQRVHVVKPGIVQRGADRAQGKLAQAHVPMLAHRDLPHADNGYVSHSVSSVIGE